MWYLHLNASLQAYWATREVTKRKVATDPGTGASRQQQHRVDRTRWASLKAHL